MADSGALRPQNQIHSAIGIEGMRAIMAAFGGRRLYVPVSIHRAGFIIRQLGRPLAEEMVYYFGGVRLSIPRGPSDFNAVGKAIPIKMIVAMTAKQMSAREIATELGCTERLVHKKRAAARKLYSHATVQPEQPRRKRART